MADKNSKPAPSTDADIIDQYLVLIECRNEEQQVELLERFQREGLKCRALLA